MGIGDRIRIAIEGKGLTLKDASEKCSISYSSLQNWVGGHREPRIESVVTIGSRLGISIDWLLTGEGQMQRGNAVNEPSATYVTRKEEAILALFRELEEDDQREIQHVAEEKKRMKAMERRLAELETAVSDAKKMA